MKIIGITGGIGAGKSQVLSFIQENYNCRVLQADLVAHLVKQPGQPCFDELVVLLGNEILNPEGKIDHGKMADRIFSERNLLEKVNGIIHPAVKIYILQEIQFEKEKGLIDYFFLEAALLLEDNYDKIVDELWYIRADKEIRKKRLMDSRNYSQEKIQSIFEKQLPDEEFARRCDVVIDNNGDMSVTKKQIEDKLGEQQ